MTDHTTRDKLKDRAEALKREGELIGKLETVLDLGFTIEDLREAVMLHDRMSGALVPSVARALPRLSTSEHRGPRMRKAPGFKELACRYCGDKFLAQKANAIMCPKRECHAKREKFTREQYALAEAAIAQALRDGSAQEFLEHVNVETSAKAAHLIVTARDRGRVLVAGDAIKAAVSIQKAAN